MFLTFFNWLDCFLNGHEWTLVEPPGRGIVCRLCDKKR